MQRLTYVVSMSLSHNHGKRPFQSCWSTHNFSVHQFRSQTNDSGYWFGNETGCAHAYKIKKMASFATDSSRAVLGTAFLTTVNLKL